MSKSEPAAGSRHGIRPEIGEGFLPVPKRIRGDKGEGARVTVEFPFVDD
jgi:hypothetical protein